MIRRLKYTECAQKINKNSPFLLKIQSKCAVFAVLTAFLRAYGVFSFLIHVDLTWRIPGEVWNTRFARKQWTGGAFSGDFWTFWAIFAWSKVNSLKFSHKSPFKKEFFCPDMIRVTRILTFRGFLPLPWWEFYPTPDGNFRVKFNEKNRKNV